MTDQNLIPLAEAVRRAGVSDKTLRRWIKSGRVTGYRRGSSERGPLFVDPSELMREVAREARLVKVATSRPEPSKPRDNRPPPGPPQPPTPTRDRKDKQPKKRVA